MITAHPTYYPDTCAWHWDEFRAPSLAALQKKLGDQVVIRDYYPMPLSEKLAEVFVRNAALVSHPHQEPWTSMRPAASSRPTTPRQPGGRRRPYHTPENLPNGRHRLDRDLLQRLWNEGMSSIAIAGRLDTTSASIRTTIRLMRDAGIHMERRLPQRRRDHHVD